MKAYHQWSKHLCLILENAAGDGISELSIVPVLDIVECRYGLVDEGSDAEVGEVRLGVRVECRLVAAQGLRNVEGVWRVAEGRCVEGLSAQLPSVACRAMEI